MTAPTLHLVSSDATVTARFLAKVLRDEETGCWLWRGAIGTGGYGNVVIARETYRAHRVAYELLDSPIPDGLTLDHLCRVRHCVNPSHLEPVTNKENMRRGLNPLASRFDVTQCIRGHELTPENTKTDRRGHRQCRICRNKAKRAARAAAKEAASSDLVGGCNGGPERTPGQTGTAASDRGTPDQGLRSTVASTAPHLDRDAAVTAASRRHPAAQKRTPAGESFANGSDGRR